VSLNLGRVVIEHLKEHPGEKRTARQIAEWIFATFPEACQAKRQSSQFLHSDADLVQQLVREITGQRPRLQKRHPELKTTEGKPRKYYYSEMSDSAEVAAAETIVATPIAGTDSGVRGEHALYPLLSQYLWQEFGVYSKRIDEKRASNRRGPNGNRWLYPDVVGMEDLSAEWHPEVRACVSQYADKRTKLWSFEVKLLINRSNARECFFQAVSNSSWANFGYLVAAEIEGPDTLKELRMLFAAHGIGLIELDIETPAESQVLIPARERGAIDWDMANRLATENKDFLEYVKLVKQFYQTGEVRPGDWDALELVD
jgi:hypothetical protein